MVVDFFEIVVGVEVLDTDINVPCDVFSQKVDVDKIWLEIISLVGITDSVDIWIVLVFVKIIGMVLLIESIDMVMGEKELVEGVVVGLLFINPFDVLVIITWVVDVWWLFEIVGVESKVPSLIVDVKVEMILLVLVVDMVVVKVSVYWFGLVIDVGKEDGAKLDETMKDVSSIVVVVRVFLFDTEEVVSIGNEFGKIVVMVGSVIFWNSSEAELVNTSIFSAGSDNIPCVFLIETVLRGKSDLFNAEIIVVAIVELLYSLNILELWVDNSPGKLLIAASPAVVLVVFVLIVSEIPVDVSSIWRVINDSFVEKSEIVVGVEVLDTDINVKCDVFSQIFDVDKIWLEIISLVGITDSVDIWIVLVFVKIIGMVLLIDSIDMVMGEKELVADVVVGLLFINPFAVLVILTWVVDVEWLFEIVGVEVGVLMIETVLRGKSDPVIAEIIVVAIVELLYSRNILELWVDNSPRKLVIAASPTVVLVVFVLIVSEIPVDVSSIWRVINDSFVEKSEIEGLFVDFIKLVKLEETVVVETVFKVPVESCWNSFWNGCVLDFSIFNEVLIVSNIVDIETVELNIVFCVNGVLLVFKILVLESVNLIDVSKEIIIFDKMWLEI
jgi:hypothetical protein